MTNFQKTGIAVFIAALTVCTVGCNNSGQNSSDSIKVVTQESEFATPLGAQKTDSATVSAGAEAPVSQETAQKPLAGPDEEIAAFIRKFYADCVFGGKDFERYKKHFSEKVLNKMEKDYSPQGGGYAVWDFRVPEVMETSDNDRITSITPTGGGWYDVSFINGEYSATMPVKASVKDGWVNIDDMKELTGLTQIGG